MEDKLLYISLALLFITSGAPVNAQNSGTGTGTETVVSVAAGAPLTVECPLRVEARADWRLNGSAPPGDMRPAELAASGRLVARLSAPAARAHHAGLYTCSRERDAHRVRVQLAPAPPAPTAGELVEAEGAADEVVDGVRVLYYDINRNLTLNCSLTSTDKTLSYVWKKNGVSVDQVAELKNRHRLDEGGAALAVTGRAQEEDYGNYTCALGAAALAWDVRGRPVARLPKNTNVVEGQKLKLQCRVLGKPYPRVTWAYRASEEANESWPLPAAGAEAGAGAEAEAGAARVRLAPNEQGVPDAALVLEAAARADAGVYLCRAGAGPPDHTVLRVKDKYAALWPFLGICAEVFVLCAIILIYEKRRTKPDLDDSDTDNHDQKKS